jgi:hypothetical protein
MSITRAYNGQANAGNENANHGRVSCVVSVLSLSAASAFLFFFIRLASNSCHSPSKVDKLSTMSMLESRMRVLKTYSGERGDGSALTK